MKEWKTYRIGDICKTNSSQYSPKEAWDEFLYLDTGNITRNIIEDIVRYSSAAELPSRARRKVVNDDIIFSTVRPNQCHFGILSNPPANLLVSTGFTVITANKKIVDPYYLYYYLTQDSIVDYLHSIGEQAVSAYPSIKAQDIEDIEIELPDLSTQNNIAKTLRALDNKIQLNRQINDNLEQQAEALYKSWFVDFEPFKDQEFVESEFGLIPEGWQCTTLSELLSIKYGKDHKKLAEGTIPVYGSGGLMRYVDTKLHEGEAVLIPRKGTLNNVMYVNEAFWTVDTMFYSIPKQENSCIYTYLFLANKDLASMNAGSAVPSMTTDILNNMLIIAPPAEVLRQFNNICNVYFSRINQNNIENANLSNQRDTLLPKLMSGELKINEIDC